MADRVFKLVKVRVTSLAIVKKELEGLPMASSWLIGILQCLGKEKEREANDVGFTNKRMWPKFNADTRRNGSQDMQTKPAGYSRSGNLFYHILSNNSLFMYKIHVLAISMLYLNIGSECFA